MIYYTLYVTAKLSNNIFDYDYLKFSRIDFEDVLTLVKNLYLYPCEIKDIQLVQYACNFENNICCTRLNNFKVTFWGNNFIYDPIFTLEKE